MAYIIYNNDGSVLTTIADGDVDSVSTSLDLVGKNVNNYGQFFNNNFTKILTNFSNSQPPGSQRTGQLWYDISKPNNKVLKIYNGTEWKPVYGTTISSTQPISTSSGELWFNPTSQQLFVYTTSTPGGPWNLIGPAVSSQLGKFGIEPPRVKIYDNNFNQEQKASVAYSYGSPTALITTASFAMSASSSSVYLGVSTVTQVVKGITVLDNLDVRGDLYVRGRHKVDKTLTAYYEVNAWADPTNPATSNLQTRFDSLNISNATLTNVILPALFPNTSTHFDVNSEARVVAVYSTSTYRSTTVRHFRLEEFIPGTLDWRPYNVYLTSYINNSLTNIISTSSWIY